ncbi:MAG TPA: DUF4124 domain-containing protein, partial [Candidatus Binatia bacterium]
MPGVKFSAPVLFSVLVLALFWAEARADVYLCKDADGAVLYTDSPTRGGCRLLIG